jgi:seryl-tRNA synthetase
MSCCEGQTDGSQSDVNFSDYTLIRGGSSNITSAVEHYTRTDTIIPTPDTTLRKLLIAGEERNNLKKQVRNLEEQVKLLSEVIKEHEGKDEVQEQAYKNQMDNLKQQLEICKEQVKAFEKMVRAERRKRRAITIGGILTTGAAILLSIKK